MVARRAATPGRHWPSMASSSANAGSLASAASCPLLLDLDEVRALVRADRTRSQIGCARRPRRAALAKHRQLISITVVNPINRCPTVVMPALEIERFESEFLSSPSPGNKGRPINEEYGRFLRSGDAVEVSHQAYRRYRSARWTCPASEVEWRRQIPRTFPRSTFRLLAVGEP
jgi:hypothetical protein